LEKLSAHDFDSQTKVNCQQVQQNHATTINTIRQSLHPLVHQSIRTNNKQQAQIKLHAAAAPVFSSIPIPIHP
jgi:hypothetical protein